MKYTKWRTLASAICPDGSITNTHELVELVTEMRYFFDRMNEDIEEREQLQADKAKLIEALNIYGVHDEYCSLTVDSSTQTDKAGACDCGLATALKELL